MENMLLTIAGDETTAFVFLFSAAACLILSFVIVCFAKSVGNKLLLLGILIALTAFVFAATVPTVAALAYAMLAIAILLVLTGVVCSLISHFSKPSQADSAPPE
jgi:hypothetical protein